MKIEVIVHYEDYHIRTLNWNHEFQAWQLDGNHAGFKQEQAIKYALGNIANEITI